MKRMVKNGDLIDVEPDGTITVAGKPVGGGGGGDYTAGSNIEISEAKEISLKRDLTDVHTIGFSDKTSCEIAGYSSGKLYIKSKDSSIILPTIVLVPFNDSYYKQIYLTFKGTGGSSAMSSWINIDSSDSNGESSYVFLTKKSKVPYVPSTDGTYVLKATVSGENVTYAWVAE